MQRRNREKVTQSGKLSGFSTDDKSPLLSWVSMPHQKRQNRVNFVLPSPEELIRKNWKEIVRWTRSLMRASGQPIVSLTIGNRTRGRLCATWSRRYGCCAYPQGATGR